MSELKIKGKITKILNVESGTSKAWKDWKKQNFVIDTWKEYNPEVCFSMFGDDKLEILSKYKEGADVEVHFNVSSREFNGKYYHNLDCWRIDAGDKTPNPELNKSDDSENDSGLPF